MSKRTLKVGQLAAITFYDHAAMGGGDDVTPLTFEAFGRVVVVSPIHYVIATWVTPKTVGDHNAEYFSIIRGAIVGTKVLK